MKFLGSFIECLVGVGFIAFIIYLLATLKITQMDVGNYFLLYVLLSVIFIGFMGIAVSLIIDAFKRGNR